MNPISSAGSTPITSQSTDGTRSGQATPAITHAPGHGPVLTHGVFQYPHNGEPYVDLGGRHLQFDQASRNVLAGLAQGNSDLRKETAAIVHYKPTAVNPAQVLPKDYINVRLTLDVRAYELQRLGQFQGHSFDQFIRNYAAQQWAPATSTGPVVSPPTAHQGRARPLSPSSAHAMPPAQKQRLRTPSPDPGAQRIAKLKQVLEIDTLECERDIKLYDMGQHFNFLGDPAELQKLLFRGVEV